MHRRSSLFVLLAVLSLVATACAESKATGFPPAPKASSTDAHGAGGEDFEAEPQTEPATTLDIKASQLTFNREEMLFVADEEIALTFENLDAVPHNVAIYPSEQRTTEADAIFVGEIFTGEAERDYEIPPTPAGEYFFRCDVHPSMNGAATFE